MPAREMFFTFDVKVKVNKTTVAQFVDSFKYYIEENFQEIKKAFEVDSIDQEFLKDFIKELKSFQFFSIENGEVHGKKRIIKDFIYDILGGETK